MCSLMIFKQITINFCNIFTEALLKYPFSSKGKKRHRKKRGKKFLHLGLRKKGIHYCLHAANSCGSFLLFSC